MTAGGGSAALPVLPTERSGEDLLEEDELPDGFIPLRDGIGVSSFMQYRACLRKIHKWQVARRCNSRSWEEIWTEHMETLESFVKKRKSAQKRANYEEKMESSFAPYQALDKYIPIEERVWQMGLNNVRSCASSLRNRYVLLHTTSGILRFESLEKAELSDFCGLSIQTPKDPHALQLMITQLATGKSTYVCTVY